MSENCLEVIQQLSTNPCAKDREGRRWGEIILLNYRANLIFLRYLLCTLHLHTYQTCASIWTAVAAHWINNCWSNGSREVCFTSALHKDKMLSFVSLFSFKSLHFRIRRYTDLKKKGVFLLYLDIWITSLRVREMPRILSPLLKQKLWNIKHILLKSSRLFILTALILVTKPDLNPIITLPQTICFAYMLMKNLEISRYFHYCQ